MKKRPQSPKPVKVRQMWTRNPVERVKDSAKHYSRKQHERLPVDTDTTNDSTNDEETPSHD